MAQDIDWEKGAYSEPAGSEPDWEKGSYSEPQKPRTRGVFEAINDTVIEGANAAAGGVSAAANFFKPGNAVSEFIDENIIKAGEAKQSDVVRAEKKAMAQGIQEADGIGGELAAVGKYVVNNPVLAAAQAAGSFVVPGAAAKVLGRVGGIGAGAAMAGGDAAGTAYDLSKQAGATEDQAVSAGRQASVIPAAVGGVTGAFGAERLLAGGKGFAGNAASRALKTGASEAGQEAVEEGVTAFEGQRAAMPYDATIDPTKGVAAAAGMGAIMGGATGAGAAGLKGVLDARATPAQAPAQPPEQPPVPGYQPQPLGASLTGTNAADLMARGTDPLAGQIADARIQSEDAAVSRNDFADRNTESLAGGGLFGSRADPLANMLADKRTKEENTSVNIQRAAEKRPPMQATAAANILVASQQQGLDFTVAPHPEGGYLVIPRAWVTPQVAQQAEASLRETLGRVAQVEDAPVQRAARVSTDPASLDLNTDAVTGYVDNLRTVNTPAAKAFVGEFDAGRITRQDVEQRMAADRGKTADERLAEAAAQARAPQDPYSLPIARPSQAMGLNPATGPMSSAAVVAVDGGAYQSVRNQAAQAATPSATPGEPTNGDTPAQAVQATPQGPAQQPAGQGVKEPRGILAKKAKADAERAAQAAATQPAATQPAAATPVAAGADAVSGSNQPGTVPALSNVQDTPQGTPGAQTQTPAVEAAAPARGNAAEAGGVPDAGAGAGVRADGVAVSQPKPETQPEPSNDAAPASQAQPERMPADGVKAGGFDSEAWDKARSEVIQKSRDAGNTHLDKVPAYVETMRGKKVYYAHDQKVRGTIRTVDNRGNVYINWDDQYSAEKEMASPMQDGKKTVMQSSIGPSDLKDYVLAKNEPAPQVEQPAKQPRGVLVKMAEQKAKAKEQEPFEHAGLKIRTTRTKVGNEVVDGWLVQSPENAEREARGERQIGGDRIVQTREQAIKTAEQEAKSYADSKAYKAEIEAKEKADRDAEEARKAAKESVKAEAAQEFTADDAQAAERQLAQMIGDRIDAMQAQAVQKIGAKFLPTMGVKAPIGKAKIKAAVTDFTKVNPLAAADEFGIEVSASIKKVLEAQQEGRLAEDLASVDDTALTISMGGSELDVDLGKPAWQATQDEVKKAVADAGFSSEVRGKYDPMRQWYEAQSIAIEKAVKAGRTFPEEMLYERPGLIRNDLNDEQADEAAAAMVDEFRKTGSYKKAVQVYRDFGKTAKADTAAQAEPDYLKELFGVDAKAIDADPFAALQAAASKDAKQQAKDVARIRESIKTEKARAKADYDDWAGRVYRRNKAQVDLNGDGPSNQASMSVGAINESRRRNAMEALNKELTELDKLEKVVATDDGAERVIVRLNALMDMAQKAVDSGSGTFKTVDEQFQYMLLDSLEFRGPSGKGNITSNGLSKAMLAAVKPAAAQAEPEEAPAEKKPAEKIEDFGEKLAGARKDYAATLKDAMSVDVAAEPLSKSWPEPDYQKLLDGGADPFMVAWVHAARDEIPTKPQTSWKLSGWVNSVNLLRKMSSEMLSGEVTKERLQEMLEKPEYGNLKRQLGGRAELYQAVGHGKSLKGITFMEHHYSMYRNEKNVTKWAIEMKAKSSSFGGWPREIAVADTKTDALAQFKAKYEGLETGPKGKGAASFAIYRKRGEAGAFIGKKIGREYIDLHKAEDVKAARTYLADNTDKLEKALERYKDTPYERTEENAPRVGGDHRNGAPVTPEVFGQTFGFRGVQFGNYVEQGRRQSDLNEAFDALMDMAAVLGIPPKAISLNGRLGLAFGARGKGGKNAPAAHYEAGNVVINLTKGGGPGSLAHEWFHAMDNYFAKQGGDVGYMTDAAGGAALREEMRQAFKSVKTAINTGALKLRSLELDKRRTKPYWSTSIEMAARSFESYVIAKLQDQNAANDYLANVVDQKVWDISEAARSEFFTGQQSAPSYPYPTVDELPALRAAFDDFFKVVQIRETDDGNTEMYFGTKTRAQGTPTDRAVMAMAGDGKSADEILRFIANASKSKFNRQIANLLRRTKANPAVSIGGDMGGGAGFKFLAKYSRKDHEVTLSQGAADRAEQIFLHETVHAATLLALDRGGEHADRMKALYESVKAQGLSGAYGMKNVGEFVAEAFSNKEFQKALKGYKAPGGTAWDRFVAAVRRILGMSDQSQDALSAALELGVEVMRENMPLRKARSFSAEDAPAFAGVDQTQTPAFQKWFGDSKVVDSAGKPMVVYHGTRRDFNAFSGDAPVENPWLFGNDNKHGFFFTANPGGMSDSGPWNGASGYAGTSQRDGETVALGGSNVMPVYLALQFPYRMTRAEYRKSGSRANLRDELEALGYDGVIVDDQSENNLEMVAFRPEQIKSATGNNGNFDPEDADIAHFGISEAVDQIKAFNVKEAPKNTWAHYRGMAMQALGRRQIVDLYAEELPQLETYNDLVQQMDAEKNDSGAEADKLAQEWGALEERAMVGIGPAKVAAGPAKHPGMDRKLAELMHDATLAKVDPSKDMPKGYLESDYAALKARYDALSPAAQKLFGKARDMYRDHYRAVQKAIKDRIERSEMSPSEKKRMMAALDDKLFKELQGVYFPLARFGQYVIVVKDANGEVKNVTRAETVKEAEAARKELLKAFPAHMGNTVGKVLKQAEFNAGRDAVGKGFMADLMGALDEKGVDDELRDTIAQLYLSSLPDLSWAKHGIHRKGTPGFSQDARRAFAQNMFHGARYLAKLRHADQLQDLLIEMQDHVKAYEGVEEYDSIQAQQVVDEMVKRHEILMNPKSSPVSTALTSFGFLFHMGLSPASAMVNLTQTALVAYPQMGAKWGFDKAGSALLKASEETVRAKNDLSTILKGDELDAFNQAVKDGTIDVTMAHDLAGIAQGEDQGVMWKVRPVMRWASFMFHHAEKFNRQATFIAAYRLAKEKNPSWDQRRLYEEAKNATYDGHFDYSSSNRARIMQGNWQRVILLFKQYAQSMVYTLARNAYQSVKGASPQEKKQARRALGGILATHAAAAGVLGLPIVGPLLTVASWIGGDDDEPWDAEVAMQNAMAEMLGPKAAEVMARGFSRLTPFDLSGRVALNQLILPDVQEGLEGKQWAESAMAAALGPVAGIGVNIARGVQKMTEGDYMRGLEDMMPTAIRGPIKALRYAQEGAVDKNGVVITDEVSMAGVFGQASGFAPSQVRRDTERRSAIYGYDRDLTERRSVLMRMFADAQMNGDTETVQDVRLDIAAFNEKNPTRRITVPNLMQSVRNRQKRIDQAQDGVYLPKNRRDALDSVSF